MPIKNPAMALGILLLAGFTGGRLARRLKLPAVTGYLLIGLLLGPSVFAILPTGLNKELGFVEVLGLGLIALIIGGELHFGKLRELGNSVGLITIAQVFGAFAATFSIMRFIIKVPLPISLLFAGLETATAPASPVAVIREYKARGTLTRTILAVVGLDDAACILIFSITVAVVAMIVSGAAAISIRMLETPAFELSGSIMLGVLLGFVLSYTLGLLRDRHQIVTVLVGVALLLGGISELLGFSALLLSMVVGLIIGNFHQDPAALGALEDVELPIFVVFFALAGASLRLDVLAANWTLVLALIAARLIGKVGGAFLGASISGAEDSVRKYLGFAMFSKAGVTIGLVLLVLAKFPQFGAMILAVELGTVVICETIGPIGTRYALIASGEAQEA